MSIDTVELGRLELTAADNYFAEYQLTDDDGNPIDMTGYTGSFDAKANLDDTVSVWSMPLVIDPDQVTNKGKFSFTGVVPLTPKNFNGKYAIRIVDAGGNVLTKVPGGSDLRIFPPAYVAP